MTAERAKARKRVMVSKGGKGEEGDRRAKETGGRGQLGMRRQKERVVRKVNKKTSSSKEFLFSILLAKQYVTAGRSAGTKGRKPAAFRCSDAVILPGARDIRGPLRPRTYS